MTILRVPGVIIQNILQSQGQVLRKMRFMPSSLTSKSHRLLTALVDSKHKKVFKVKAFVTEVDPEKEKEAKERVCEVYLSRLFLSPPFSKPY